MDKITFLNELEYQLHRLPNHVVDEVMNEYENHFYREGLDGKSDEA
ncbi:HAAS signaling domain-containing protein, partial [Staphylococcus pseudintermedius]